MKKKLLNRFARTTLGKKTLARVGNTIDDKQWIFVLGCYNSGTTLLQRLMQAHPDIGAMNAEGVAYTDVVVRPEEYGWTRMWWKCASELREHSDYSVSGAKRLRAQWSCLLNKPKARYALEKSIVNVLHLPFYREYFKGAKFIHIIRNGYAVSEGIRRKANPSKWKNPDYQGQYPISLCAAQWVENLNLISSYKAEGTEIFEVKYEDLTADPDAVLSEIFRFLNLSTLDDSVENKEWLVHGATSGIKNMNGRSLERLSDKEKVEIYNVSGSWLEELDYDA